MALPAEVRPAILEMVIAPDGELYPLSTAWKYEDYHPDLFWGGREQIANVYSLSERETAHVSMGFGYDSETVEYMFPESCPGFPSSYELKKAAAPNKQILCCSKQLCEEALQATWEGVTKCFIDPEIFRAVSDLRVGAMNRFNVLGRIELSFTNADWFYFFGIDAYTLQQDDTASLHRYLTRPNAKTKLTVRFRDPLDGFYRGDPWHGGRRKVRSTGCQRILIDWILTFAFPYIVHMKVNLTGFICKPQKETWTERLVCGRTGRCSDFNHDAAMKTILETPKENLPPRCICPRDCRCFSLFRQDGGNSEFDFEDDDQPAHG
ncbi:hypothetical protein E8E13_002942 [Curvularia kusanoi]|uniref:Uncharacterized protein n=1 Tax=Curvularia kusanoi TaxID=90978 RepID=A0A9P4T945_CURKU|nr:hypothetical protein E8E13_002942 [Curvularia kusanoi]